MRLACSLQDGVGLRTAEHFRWVLAIRSAGQHEDMGEHGFRVSG